MLDLFEHNRIAYRSALELMVRTGKAAVIHPTGTGKSIIAFKLIEDHPEKRVCWLSPSKYIVQTQRENVRRIDPNFSDAQVFYCTYAKLMNMDRAELQAICPEYIILDEFHRCGAAEWGKGVQTLLEMYPEVPVLGLSATSIRYLDNQRDMAEELFGGNVASEMSVAEAIATGILPAPVYVIALFSYQKELEKYERRVNSLRHRSNYDANRRYLEALRRTLEMSVGLDQIFQKHMTEKSGKYIVFCSGKEHMDLVEEHIPEWFSGVDRDPHVYHVYSEEPGSEQAFLDFKSDNSGHLKLLLCIDMLSEGIHVDNISGVILLRPTTSPIIYKQQIGRALAAGKGGTPLIFDVVNNFDSLVSVSWLREDIQSIVQMYQQRGQGGQIVEDSFRIIDEVRECRRLLDQLENSLSATWEVNFQAARAYFQAHGDLSVPVAYRTETGIQLGVWISYQRQLYNAKYRGSLTGERIEKLNRIGMVWENRHETHWDYVYQLAEAYYVEHGHLRVPTGYIAEDGTRLGRWVYRQANNRENLSEEKLEQLNSIGMVWDSSWDVRYETAFDFLRNNPGYELSQTTVIDDFWVGKWLVQQLRAYEKGLMNEAQTEKIEQMIRQTGITAQTQIQRKWMKQFAEAKALSELHGAWRFWPETAETKKSLRWIKNQLKKMKSGVLRQDEVEKLRSIGVQPEEKEDPWMRFYREAERYCMIHGNLDVPASYVTSSGIHLGSWICRQRTLYKSDKHQKGLSKEQIELLEKLGMEWNPYRRAFENGISAAQRYYEVHGNLKVPAKFVDDFGFPLYQWISDIKKRKNRLSEEDIHRLDAMHFAWKRERETAVTG